MDNVLDVIRGVIISLLASLVAYLNPIAGAWQSLLMLLAINFLAGLFTGMIVQDESFSFKKFKSCVGEGALFLGLISFVYFLGERNGNQDETVLCVTAITYIIIYCYGLNILKNVRLWCEHGKSAYIAIDMLYYILSIEFIKRFPAFDKYKQQQINKEEEVK